MEIDSGLDKSFESFIICKECSNIPLLGIEILDDSDNLKDIIKLFSYCIFNHKNKENRIKEYSMNDLHLNDEKSIQKIISIKNPSILCEYCKKEYISYSCLECKRNICENCFNFHKSHKFYSNKEYLMTKDELKKIKENFNKSKNILEQNISLIDKQINKFKSELNNLENFFLVYKSLNEKLDSLSKFIIEKNELLLNSKESIYYPCYFNLKNVLLFNCQELNISDEEISLHSYLDKLKEKINSGAYFLLNSSGVSKNLNEYNINKDAIDLNTINFDEFNEIELNYKKVIYFEKNKLLGIDIQKNSLEIYNIDNKAVETLIKFNSKNNNYNIFYKNNMNLILAMTDLNIYIIDSKNLTIIQEIKFLDDDQKKNKKNEEKYSFWKRTKFTTSQNIFHKFVYAEFLSDNSIMVIFEGDIEYLDDNAERLIENSNFNVINFHNYDDNDNNHKYIYLLIYKKDINLNFNLEKIKVLLRKEIDVNEVDYTSGKYFENEDTFPYCIFYFKNLNKLSNDAFILCFKSKIMACRDQEYYYITDNIYSDEMIYYYIDINNENSFKKIFSTKENSYLFLDEKTKKYYFLFDESEKEDISLDFNQILKGSEIIKIKTDDLDRYFYTQKKTILSWDEYSIFIGKIISEKIEILKNFDKKKKGIINLVVINPNLIIYYNLIE